MSKDYGIYRNAFPRPDSFVVQPYSFADQLPLHGREDSKLKTSFANLGVCIAEFRVFLSNSSVRAASLPAFRDTRLQ